MDVSGDEICIVAKVVPFGKVSRKVPPACNTSSVLIVHLISKFSPICGLSGVPVISNTGENTAYKTFKILQSSFFSYEN